MITEEQYLENKKEFDLVQQNYDNFIQDHFKPLFFKFNDFFINNKNFEFEIKSISAQTASCSIHFSCYSKDTRGYSSTDRLYVNFEIKNKDLYLTYTEDNSQRPFNNMKQKSILYVEVVRFFENFNIEDFLNLCQQYDESSKELSKLKREFTKIETEYFASLNLKYQKAFLTVIKQVDKEKVLSNFEVFIETEIKRDEVSRYNTRNEFRGFCFSFDLDKILFNEFYIKIDKDKKTNKPIFYLRGKKTSKKKCVEAITNQFYYKDKLIKNFEDFKNISIFTKNNFENYSSFQCKAYIKNLMNPFMANIIAQEF